MKDEDLRRHIAAELSWDPQVDTEGINISAADGTVTLRGTVTSLRLKQAGGRAAARVRGVTSVVNELQVELPDADRRDDEDLRGDVREALMLDASVPTTVDAQAQSGLVTLTGAVQWHYQREAAETRTTDVPGVAGINNAITLTQTPDAYAAREAITGAFRRNASLEVDVLSAETSHGGRVTLSGTVSSWAAHDQAVTAAWSAPGVTQVDDRIRVESRP
jgi:osmotically-inducible protein OsmY